MRFVLALDQGTTSSRAVVFDSTGAVRHMAQVELTQYFPQPGWVEHDANEIFNAQLTVAREALTGARVAAEDIAGIGITNQRETVVVWNRRTGAPIHHALVWQDRRTTAACEQLRAAGHEALVRAKTGLVIDPYFSATKIAWLLDHVAGARELARRGELAFGTIDAWLIWKLTAGAIHVTDPTNASRTLLFNIATGDWDDALLELFNIPRAILPQVWPSASIVGMTALEMFGRPLPIAGIAGDQQAALFGQACHRSGMAKNTYGTGCFMLMDTGTTRIESAHGLLTTCAARVATEPQNYALEGAVFIAGAAVQWLRDGLRIIGSSAEVEPLAAQVESTEGVYFVPAFTGLGAPHWDARARGTLVGLTRGSSAAHIARAALESIAFQSAEVLLAMQADAGIKLAELRVDGGAAANALLMQFQADLLGVRVVRPRNLETTALGAAYLAGLATGVWGSREEIARQWRMERVFEPLISRDQSAARLNEWRRAVERSKGWAT
jgi:glycerol kinase